MKQEQIALTELDFNTGQIEGLPTNPRQWTREEVIRLADSIKQTPELLEARGLIVYPHGGRFIIMGGNMRYEALKHNRAKVAPCIVLPADMPLEKLKEIVIKDNGAFGSWDYDALANEWDDLPLPEWGVPVWDTQAGTVEDIQATETSEEEENERKRKEFEERMAAGENLEEDEEYNEFVAKFEQKKTTDDCYTPEIVYEAVAQWVENEYKLKRANFVRPFYPGGDYENAEYPAGCVVVDNPPFSILAKICRFYNERKIAFFLFAPHLTLLSSADTRNTYIGVGGRITYENGAVVNTSFITNISPDVMLRSAPALRAAMIEADAKNRDTMTSCLPKYTYDGHIITSTMLEKLSLYGVSFSVARGEGVFVSELDAQKEHGKAIFGKGALCSDKVAAEKEDADKQVEKEKIARENATAAEKQAMSGKGLSVEYVWALSPRERAIVASLKPAEPQKHL